MNITRYEISCSECGGRSRVEIDEVDRVFWYDVDQVISTRKRLDNLWGWQCLCGNNDLMTDQEKRMISDPTQPKPQELEDIVKNIEIQAEKFSMVAV